MYIFVEGFVLPSKNLQVDAGPDVGDLAVEDLVVHRSCTDAALYDFPPQPVADPHRQGAGEYKGDCDKKSGLDQSTPGDIMREKN